MTTGAVWSRLSLAAALVMGVAGSLEAACPGDAEPCAVGDGTYHAVTPDTSPRGAVVFLHGWGSSGQGSLRMSGMVRSFTDRGYVVIAPNGTPREGRSGRTWAFHPDRPGSRDEFAFLRQVRDDAAQRFGLNPARMMLAGFSIGGSMASYVACLQPGLFAAYAPVGGGMWRPHPQSCAGPVKLLHTHGWADGTVPLEGRAVAGAQAREPGAFVQGDIFATMETFRVANGCIRYNPDRRQAGERFWRRAWTDCADGTALELALHAGGHSMPQGWSDMALDWFEAQALAD